MYVQYHHVQVGVHQHPIVSEISNMFNIKVCKVHRGKVSD